MEGMDFAIEPNLAVGELAGGRGCAVLDARAAPARTGGGAGYPTYLPLPNRTTVAGPTDAEESRAKEHEGARFRDPGRRAGVTAQELNLIEADPMTRAVAKIENQRAAGPTACEIDEASGGIAREGVGGIDRSTVDGHELRDVRVSLAPGVHVNADGADGNRGSEVKSDLRGAGALPKNPASERDVGKTS